MGPECASTFGSGNHERSTHQAKSEPKELSEGGDAGPLAGRLRGRRRLGRGGGFLLLLACGGVGRQGPAEETDVP